MNKPDFPISMLSEFSARTSRPEVNTAEETQHRFVRIATASAKRHSSLMIDEGLQPGNIQAGAGIFADVLFGNKPYPVQAAGGTVINEYLGPAEGSRYVARFTGLETIYNQPIDPLEQSIRKLTECINELQERIEGFNRVHRLVVPLTTLAPHPFELKAPIPVTIESEGEDFTATFLEANVSASGDTEADAIANFKDSLISTLEILETLPPEAGTIAHSTAGNSRDGDPKV